MPSPLPFKNRKQAGDALAEALLHHAHPVDALILALVRGGVVIGAALASRLRLPLFPYIVRKIGHPANPEFGLGALAEGGATYVDSASLADQGLTMEDLRPVIEKEMRELKRRKKAYTIRPLPHLAGRTIILTDDGAATGATLFAAIEDLRAAHAGRITVALPLCPPDTALRLGEAADDLVVLATPEPFTAVGQWYADFPQVEDDEVRHLLKKHANGPS